MNTNQAQTKARQQCRQRGLDRSQWVLHVTPAERQALQAYLYQLRTRITGSVPTRAIEIKPYHLWKGANGWDWHVVVNGRPVAGVQRHGEGKPQKWRHIEICEWRARALDGSAMRPWFYGRTPEEAAVKFLSDKGGSSNSAQPPPSPAP